MKIVRISVVAAFILMIGAAGIANGALAQQDQRFFGRWEPSSTSAGGWPLIIEPGRMYSLTDKNEIVDEQKYQVIRDFGDHVVIKIWPIKPMMEGANTDPSLDVWIVTEGPPYELRLSETKTLVITEGPPSQMLEIDDCVNPAANSFFFSTDDPDEVWARILTWSKKEEKSPEGFRYCAIDPETLKGLGSGMGFYRELEQK